MLSSKSSRPPPRAPRVGLVPEQGPENPLFRAVDGEDTVDATLLFERTLTEDELDEAESAVLAWFAGAEWGGRLPILVDETLTSTCLHVAVTGVRKAQDALSLLVHTMTSLGVPVARAVFARLRADGDRDALLHEMDPGALPQVEYDDPGDWWRACFDPSAGPPLSEDRAELADDRNALLEVDRTTYAERRGVPLHLPDLRICYGLAPVTFDAPPAASEGANEEPSRSARGREVARVLRTALGERFGAGASATSIRPVPYNRRSQNDAALDHVLATGRAGYSCAFHTSDLREFLHAHLFRYREYELMLAVRDAVRVLDLAPVVCWRRFHGRYVVQIWERETSRVHAAA